MRIPGQTTIRNMFGLDYRSIALLRIGLGTLILCSLYVSAWNLRGLYTDEGVLPRSLLLANYGPVFSLHMAGGSVVFEAAMFAAQAVLALLMIVGYRTRIVTIASYVLLFSLQARNPLLNFGADITFRLCFFWAMFLPLNRRFSLDAATGRVSPAETPTYLGIPCVTYLVQFALIYLFGGLLKTGPTWTVDYTAVSYALSLDVYGRPLGAWLNQYDTLTTWLTFLTPYAEIYGTLLLVLPLWSGWGRLIACAVFAGLQIGFSSFMQMGLFGPVMIVVSFALLPAEFWTYFATPPARWFALVLARWRNSRLWPERAAAAIRGGLERRRLAESHLRSGAPAWPRLRWFSMVVRDAIALFLIVYVVVWNLDTLPGSTRRISAEYAWIATSTGLDQVFNFFSPDPRADDGWFVIAGELRNGQRVNAFTGEPSVTFDRPANIYNTYIDQRWNAFLICLWNSDSSQFLEPLSRYLVDEWNRRHTGDEQMIAIEITFMHEIVGPGHTRSPAAPELLWTQSF